VHLKIKSESKENLKLTPISQVGILHLEEMSGNQLGHLKEKCR